MWKLTLNSIIAMVVFHKCNCWITKPHGGCLALFLEKYFASGYFRLSCGKCRNSQWCDGDLPSLRLQVYIWLMIMVREATDDCYYFKCPLSSNIHCNIAYVEWKSPSTTMKQSLCILACFYQLNVCNVGK